MIKNSHQSNCSREEKGATLIEYVIAVGIMVIAMGTVIAVLQTATFQRADKSMKTTEGALPCDGPLSGDECL